jgi:DNA (cytosine-5)-methyltransferase 1
MKQTKPTSFEICAGGGGQALGLEQAGFEHVGLLEIDPHSCATLRHNRPNWNVIEGDLNNFDGSDWLGVDLLAGGLPCPPFSVAGKQLGAADERNLFPAMLRLVEEMKPRAIMIENVRGFLDAVFTDYRETLKRKLEKMGYVAEWRLVNASDYGVPQLRPRVAIVAVQKELSPLFSWPAPGWHSAPTVGRTLQDLMASNGWVDARAWASRADEIAPTIVGGSKKHGGPDLGPTRSRKAWATLGVDGRGIADEAPARDFVGMPRLTTQMVAKLQGFPGDWKFAGGKTAAYRQIGNAFPPPVAEAVGFSIRQCLRTRQLRLVRQS